MGLISVPAGLLLATVALLYHLGPQAEDLLDVLPNDPQEAWKVWLETPPPLAVNLTAQAVARADVVAARLPAQLSVSGALDVVVSGGGNLDGYFLGAWMVFNRLAARTDKFSMVRFNGASAGAQAPFELALKGESITLQHHFAYGLLEEAYPVHFSQELIAAMIQVQSWTIMSDWQVQKWQDRLASLSGRIYLTLSCLRPFPSAVTVSDYSASDLNDVSKAFQATGSPLVWYKSMICSDGGSVSGPDMTPLFKDKQRAQIIVNLMKMGTTEEVAKEDSKQIQRLVEKGQDDALEFLQTGRTESGGLSLCPASADTSSDRCVVH